MKKTKDREKDNHISCCVYQKDRTVLYYKDGRIVTEYNDKRKNNKIEYGSAEANPEPDYKNLKQ